MRQKATAQYATQPANGIWTQVEVLTLHIKSQPELDVHLYILLVIRDQSQFINVSSFYQSIRLRLQSLGQSYSADKEEQFSSSLTKLIQEIVTDTQEVSLELVVAYQFENKLFAGGYGGGTVILVRNGELGKILDTSQGTTMVKGNLVKEDILLLASDQFYVHLPYSQLKRVMTQRYSDISVETITSEIVVILHQKTQSEGVGFIFSEFSLDTDDKTSDKNSSWFRNIQRKLKLKKAGAIQPSAKVFLKQRAKERRRQRLSVLLTITILIVLMLSLMLGWWRRKVQAAEEAFQQISDPVVVLMDQAQQQQELNPLLARALLQQAKDQLSIGISDFDSSSKWYVELEKLQTEVSDLYQEVAGENLVEPDQFLDLSFIEPGLFGERLGTFEDRVVVVDTQKDQVVSIGAESKDPSDLISGNLLQGASLTSGSIDQFYVMTASGIVAVSSDEAKVVIEKDPDWQNVTGMGAFAGNIYLLDSDQNEIWRYRNIAEDTFSRERWLAPGVSPDFSHVVDLDIDGDIWVLDQNGVVRKYSRGVGETIELIGVEEDLQVKALSITEEYIILFDPSKNRVLLFDKNGQYQKQYVWSDIGLVTDMVVLEGKIFLLAGDKLFDIPLE